MVRRRLLKLILLSGLVTLLTGVMVITLEAQNTGPLALPGGETVFAQQQKIVASDGAVDNYFGTVVAIDGD
ncbi:MAG TPA: FG-GAP repeat protein, partial [Phototrophicaceae bacterium]|nr:FG-GAP repeat protein [Phototrophicaceae bacterium]